MGSICILAAHPALHRSRINRRLLEALAPLDGVDIVDLYETYPDFDIDVPREQERLRRASAIIFHHPMYWYATPALLKEYVDLVFAYGFAYGDEQQELADKILAQAITCGADESTYRHDGFNGVTIKELLRPMAATAHFCGMRWIDPFVTYGGQAIEDAAILEAAEKYRLWIKGLIADSPPQVPAQGVTSHGS